MPHLSIHIKTKPGGIIKQPCILATYHQVGEMGAIIRMLDHRQVDCQFLATRPASAEEVEAEDHPYRLGCLVYTSWERLINDEGKYADALWLMKLDNLRSRFPQFNNQQQPATGGQ